MRKQNVVTRRKTSLKMASFFLERIRSNAVNDATAQAKWSEKKLVWIADKTEGYLQASVIGENGDELEVQLEDNTVH